ncbi:phage tail protein [Duganella sp. CY15W]|uniref:phage tail sheath C-terminal domain-containing protein n=1 Tax=Duganella sp. CY15W TaxID=2692172 RepID=UPI001371A17F|nr:phage tail sheath C-terminal domain-containing protein [Duganella sp. CY15W]MYM32262.1 phage tail protein [Duganella sp. CY15W]
MASPNISFSAIPASIRKPGKYFEFNTALAVRTLAANSQKVLLLGQRVATGQVNAGVLVDIFTDMEAAKYFGYGSQLHLMASAAISTNPNMALQAVAVDDAGGATAATGTITIAGAATAAGSVTLNVANDVLTVAVASADTPTVIAASIVAGVTARPDLPVSAAAAGGVVTLTAKNKGSLGNQIKVSTVLTGVTGITSTVVAMAGGATDPTIASTLATVAGAGHTIIATAFNDATNLAALRSHLDSVSSPMEQRGAIGAAGHTGTLAQSTTLGTGVNAGRVSLGLVPGTLSLPYEVAAAYAGLIASEEDPARPLNGLALAGIGVIPLANRLLRQEQETALANGVTPFEVGPGGLVQIVRAVSTYVLDPNGIPDISLLDITTIRTLDYVRKTMRERIALRFPRDKLSMRTPDRVRSELLDVMYKLEELEIIENVELYKPGLIVERDIQDPNRLDAKIPTDVVNGLHVFGGRIDLIL